MYQRPFILAACLLALVSLSFLRAPSLNQDYRETLYVFGTLVEIEIRGEPVESARAAVAEIAREFDRVHVAWHAWHEGGELGAVNQAIARGEAIEVSPELASLLTTAQSLSKESEGLFEPAIGGVIAAWGFHADEPPSGKPPSAGTIATWVAANPRLADLTIDGNTVRSSNKAVRIDLGGVAKGAALDLAADILKRRGIENAVLNAGGDLNVLGKYAARPWNVAIRDPFGWQAVASVEMRPGEVLYTSGNYERYLEYDGERFSHIIDPRTGRPVNDIVSASVLHKVGTRADAAATALSVAGAKDWSRIADRMNVDLALLIDGKGKVYLTPGMAKRVKFHVTPTDVIVVEPTKQLALARHAFR